MEWLYNYKPTKVEKTKIEFLEKKYNTEINIYYFEYFDVTSNKEEFKKNIYMVTYTQNINDGLDGVGKTFHVVKIFLGNIEQVLKNGKMIKLLEKELKKLKSTEIADKKEEDKK